MLTSIVQVAKNLDVKICIGPLQPIISFVQDVDFDCSGAQGACRCGERGARRVVGGQATEVTSYLMPSQSVSIHLNPSLEQVI